MVAAALDIPMLSLIIPVAIGVVAKWRVYANRRAPGFAPEPRFMPSQSRLRKVLLEIKGRLIYIY
jgi:hypothetical protein